MLEIRIFIAEYIAMIHNIKIRETNLKIPNFRALLFEN